MATSEPYAHVEQLSLFGLLSRLELLEKMKQIKSPNEEEKLLLASESDAKKAVLERLSSVAAGLPSREKAKAKEFLLAQVRSVEPGSKNADARIAKLRSLLSDVESAPDADEPSHVRKAKADFAKAEKDFDVVHKDYEKWEKGKKMLSVDELNVLKRNHEDLQQRVDALKVFKERQMELRLEAAEPPPTTNKVLATPGAGAGRSKAAGKAPNAVHGGGPAVRTLGGAAPSRPKAAAGGYPGPSAAALRQAQLVAQVRVEAEEAAAASAAPAEPKPARGRPKVGVVEEEQVVLSYECTVSAVAEVAGMKKDDARALASSSKEFRSQFDAQTWERIKERSQAIEREKKEKEREAERKKQAAAMARAEAKAAGATQSPLPQSKAKPKPKAPPPSVASTAQAKPKGDPGMQAKIRKQRALLEGMATTNPFGGLEAGSSDEEGAGWTEVGR